MKFRVKLVACLIAGHFLCIESFAGIASGLNTLDSRCNPGACSCARMSRGHHRRALARESCPLAKAGLAPDSGPCGAHKGHESPPPSLKIASPLSRFDVVPGQLKTGFRRGLRHRTWQGYRDVELPPPR